MDKPISRRIERRPDADQGVRLAFDFGEPLPMDVADSLRAEATLARHNPVLGLLEVHGASVNGVTVRVDVGKIDARARTLVDLLAACRVSGDPLSAELAVGIVLRAAEIVGGLHASTADGKARVHGHLHAGAVLLDGDGSVRVIGPGLPYLNALLPPPSSGADFVMPAPEHGRGEPPTTATDIYGLATILCQALADTNGPVTRPLALLSDVSPDLRGVLSRALDADPAKRHPTVAAFVSDLTAADTTGATGAVMPEPLRMALEFRRGLAPLEGPGCLADSAPRRGDNLGPETLILADAIKPSEILGAGEDDKTNVDEPRRPPPDADTTPDEPSPPPRTDSGWAGVLGEPVPRAPSVVAEEEASAPTPVANTPATPVVGPPAQPLPDIAAVDTIAGPTATGIRIIESGGLSLYRDNSTSRSIGAVVGVGLTLAALVFGLNWLTERTPDPVEPVRRILVTGDMDAGLRVKPNRRLRPSRRRTLPDDVAVAEAPPPTPPPATPPPPTPTPTPATPPPPPKEPEPPKVTPMRLLSVMSKPSGASVELDGGYIGKTPLVLKHELANNQVVQLRVLADGYQPWSQQLKVDPAKGALNVRAELVAKRTVIR